jgi:membrane protein DedA with SNARE-associated domain/rhodanese-related sulfurtransferase
MHETLHFLARHGYLLLAGSVLGRQACLPIPANLFLIAAGALAHDGKLNFSLAVAVSVMTFMLADLAWYDAGRRFGHRILHFVCGLSRDPDSCVQRADDTFARHGVNTLLVSKFVIGLDAVAVPMTGSAGVRPMHFMLFEALGALFWSLSYASLGYIFSNQLDRVAVHIARMGIISAIALGLIVCYYIARRLTRWFRFLRLFKLARITPEELRNKLSRGEDLLLLDLQGRQHSKANPMAIPGAVRINPRHLEQYNNVQIPLSQEVVLYCACPGEFTSARVALALQRRGIEHVRPLAGGLEAWRDCGFPLTLEVRTVSSLNLHS